MGDCMPRKKNPRRRKHRVEHSNVKTPDPYKLIEKAWFWPLASLIFFGIFFSRVIGGDWVLSPPYTDIYRISYPFIQYIDQSLDSRVLPLWNPYQYAGTPFAANGEASFYYLPKLILCFLFDGTDLLGWYALLHAWLGWIAMFILLKEYNRSLPICILGAFAWIFSGLGMGHLPWIAFIGSAVVWFPLCVLIIKKSTKRHLLISIGLLGICSALLLTAGIASYPIPIVIMLSIYSLYLWLKQTDRKARLGLHSLVSLE
jgi:hypothetical protein